MPGCRERVNGLCKAEYVRTTVFHTGPYKAISDVEHATAVRVDRYDPRFRSSLGSISPVGYESVHDAALTEQVQLAQQRQRT